MSGQHRVSTAEPVLFLADGVARTFDYSRRTEAEDWWASTDFLPIVHEHNSKVSGDDSFNRPELQPLREAYAAGLFAWILGEQHKVRVKLDKDRFPDFHLDRAGQTLSFELVEAYRPGVRRAAEYREAAKRRAAGLPEELTEFDPVQDETTLRLRSPRQWKRKRPNTTAMRPICSSTSISGSSINRRCRWSNSPSWRSHGLQSFPKSDSCGVQMQSGVRPSLR
jgi:hypothetical protein